MYFEIFFEYILEKNQGIVLRGEEKIVPICKIYWERSMKFAPDFFFLLLQYQAYTYLPMKNIFEWKRRHPNDHSI